MRRTLVWATSATAALAVITAGAAQAKFAPKIELEVAPTKVKANPTFTIRLALAADDSEIGQFTLKVPRGYTIASDAQVPDVPASPGRPQGDLLGTGKVTIQGGPGCHPQFPTAAASGPVTVDAKVYERPLSDAEMRQSAVAAWVLDIEPLNRVRLVIAGSPTAGYTATGGPTPSDFTCNPLSVDLQINGVTEKGVPLIVNPATPGPRTFTVVVKDQDGQQSTTLNKVVFTTR